MLQIVGQPIPLLDEVPRYTEATKFVELTL